MRKIKKIAVHVSAAFILLGYAAQAGPNQARRRANKIRRQFSLDSTIGSFCQHELLSEIFWRTLLPAHLNQHTSISKLPLL